MQLKAGYESVRTSTATKRITFCVINMQTSSRWQTRLGFENLNYFSVIIYLPVHRFSIPSSPAESPMHAPQLHTPTFIYDLRISQTQPGLFLTVMYRLLTGHSHGALQSNTY